MKKYMLRRNFLMCSAAIVLLPATTTDLRSQGGLSRLALLKDLVAAVDAATDALSKFVDLIRKIAVAGAEAYDEVKRRLIHAELVEISATTTSVLDLQVPMVDLLTNYAHYVKNGPPVRAEDVWQRACVAMQLVLNRVRELLERVRSDRSDFVLEPSYAKLSDALQRRASLLEQLLRLQAPREEPELRQVDLLADRYRTLIKQLKTARDEMNTYIHTTR